MGKPINLSLSHVKPRRGTLRDASQASLSKGVDSDRGKQLVFRPMKLNQVVAVEKALRARVHEETTALYQASGKAALFTGLRKDYLPKREDDETYPREEQKVQLNAEEVLRSAGVLFANLFNVVSRKDWANTVAKADVVVGDRVLIKQAPVHYILFVGKQLEEIRKMVDKLPVRDPGLDWFYDRETDLWKTSPIESQRTRKVKRTLVKYDATPQHPAQTESYDADEVAGTWSKVNSSGAISAVRKKELLARCDLLGDALKIAIGAANVIDAPAQQIGEGVIDFLLHKE
jgi:hypothetical protein